MRLQDGQVSGPALFLLMGQGQGLLPPQGLVKRGQHSHAGPGCTELLPRLLTLQALQSLAYLIPRMQK